jgi:hypothetical protein
VARYCLLVVEAEGPGATAALLAEVRQLEDRLGLTAPAMQRLQWEIAEREPKAPAAEELDERDNVTYLYGEPGGSGEAT